MPRVRPGFRDDIPGNPRQAMLGEAGCEATASTQSPTVCIHLNTRVTLACACIALQPATRKLQNRCSTSPRPAYSCGTRLRDAREVPSVRCCLASASVSPPHIYFHGVMGAGMAAALSMSTMLLRWRSIVPAWRLANAADGLSQSP